MKENHKDSEEKLVEEMLTLLSSSEEYFPDDTLDWSFPPHLPPMFRQRLSCIFMKGYEKNYGTRAQTVLLLDFEGNGVMLEKNSIPPEMRAEGAEHFVELVRTRFRCGT